MATGNPRQEVRGPLAGNEVRAAAGCGHANMVSAHQRCPRATVGAGQWSRAAETGEAECTTGGAGRSGARCSCVVCLPQTLLTGAHQGTP